jgi:uncharacterized protein (DUF952 family)
VRPTFHLTPAEAWTASRADEPYLPASLQAEGFVHCTDGVAAMVATANRHYADDPRDFVVLTVDLDALDVPWRYDDPGSPYPHIYGPIPRAAILTWSPIERDADGHFVSFEP